MADSEEWWVVDKVMALTLRVSRLYGVAPVRFHSRGSRIVYLSRLHYYIGIMITFTLAITLIYSHYGEAKIVGTTNTNFPFNKKLIVIVSGKFVALIFANFTVFRNYTRMRNILDFMTRVRHIRKAINDFYPNLKRWRLVCFAVLLTVGPWTHTFLELNTDLMRRNFWKLFLLTYTNTFWLFIEIQFVIVARSICATFRDLNKRLEDILLQLSVPHGNTHRAPLARKVRYLSQIFASICRVMLDLNDTENFNLFCHLCIVSFNLEYVLNILLRDVANIALKTENLGYFLGPSIFALFNVVRILLLVEPCHETREQISHTRLLVGKVMSHVTSETDQLLEPTDTFFKQLLLNDISYNVIGICAIDRRAISIVIGATTTILSLILN